MTQLTTASGVHHQNIRHFMAFVAMSCIEVISWWPHAFRYKF
jgi:hypothetical protein